MTDRRPEFLHVAKYKPFLGDPCWAVFTERGAQPVECRTQAAAKAWAEQRYGPIEWELRYRPAEWWPVGRRSSVSPAVVAAITGLS